MTAAPQLRDLLLLAYIDGLHRQAPAPALTPRVRLDDTGRAPYVPLRPAGGPRG